ncbi:TetR/AcrR family transcriptional regulator [Streptomyces sp. NRRL F-5126]|uniref:TetR/AcrR family transcriptional regulator n=1 Tax=Streptomyces sp. NRRL F-5126 TaxID=1463857 RepID=UPI0004CB1BB3
MPADLSRKTIRESPDSGNGVSGGLRSDAQRNRDRIVRAAHETFTERGTAVPISAIARRAGVGAATLYRRFPTRASLVAAVFDDQLTECATAFDEALADPDPWHGFRSFVETVCAAQVADRGFTSAFLAQYGETDDGRRQWDRAEPDLARLVQRAKEAGRLRGDFDPSDVLVLLLANNGLAAQPPHVSEPASRRLVAYFLQSAEADRTKPLPPAAPLGLDQIRRLPTGL